MIRFSGAGSFRTRVGIARIWSPAASFGFTSRSMTSISYRPAQVLLADALEVGHGGKGLGRLPGHVKPQVVVAGIRITVRILFRL